MKILVKTTDEEHAKRYDAEAMTVDAFSITIYTIDDEIITIPIQSILSMIILD